MEVRGELNGSGRKRAQGSLQGVVSEQVLHSECYVLPKTQVLKLRIRPQVSSRETYQAPSSAPRLDTVRVPVTCSQTLPTSRSLKCALELYPNAYERPILLRDF